MHLLFAYIDPGSGSLLIQAVIAAVASVTFFFRHHIGNAWHRLRGGLRRGQDAAPGESDTSKP